MSEASRPYNAGEVEALRFSRAKAEWCSQYPDFRRIAVVMERFEKTESLCEYKKHCPPTSIHAEAEEVYRKCLSFRTKLSKKLLSVLRLHPDTPRIHYPPVEYCIDSGTVFLFLKEYQSWVWEIGELWNPVYTLCGDYSSNACIYTGLGAMGGYENYWEHLLKYPDMLKTKADDAEALLQKVLELLNRGSELVSQHDLAISAEYHRQSFEMSLYERELEIAAMCDEDDVADEEYCYVYVLECELCVFYAGIAANPAERFDQHVRGAFSDEARLFKSKFIQKYRNQVRQRTVFEGTRRQCKEFEKKYIAKHQPLGNMTPGGEG